MDTDLREQRLADLRRKLEASRGKPGLKERVEAIEKQIHDLENPPHAFRNGNTGRFVDLRFVIQNPETSERVELNDGD